MYTKTNWATATITPENLNKMQTQYQLAVEDALGVRIDNNELRCEIVSEFPAHKAGRIIFHSGLKTFFFSTGTEWHLQPTKVDFGNANLGDFSSTGNVTFTNTVGASVVRNYQNFTLNAGHTLTTENPGRILAIRAWGDITINGTIDLSKKGGYGARYLDIFGTSYDLIGGDGGNGGNGNGATNGGTTDLNEQVAGGRKGGGGGGGYTTGGTGGGKNAGSATGATSVPLAMATTYDYSSVIVNGVNGGSGQGATGNAQAIGDSGNTLARAVSFGGAGTVNVGASGGGGVCFVYGANLTRQTLQGTAGDIGGGVIILLAMGTVTINGQLLANGGNGGNGAAGLNYFLGTTTEAQSGGGAGGSGGGRILVIHQNGYNNAGLVQATGGLGGLGGGTSLPGQNGSAGSNGNISVVQLT